MFGIARWLWQDAVHRLENRMGPGDDRQLEGGVGGGEYALQLGRHRFRSISCFMSV